MKKSNKKIVISIICSIIIFISVMAFSQTVYAENETKDTKNATESSANVTNNNVSDSSDNSKNTTKEVAKKSSNANLKDFGIKPHDFSGFKPEKTSYEVTVPSEAESVEIYAILQDENAKITGTGIKNLELGNNNFEVTVIAEDGTKKTYTINIIREEETAEKEEQEQNTEAVQEKYSGDGLANLNIENLELSPKFDTVIYEYTVKYIGENTKLSIETTTTDPYYTVEITGNEELKEGENIINILVSDPDSKNIATYQITVNKSLVDEEAVAREQEELRKKEQQKQFIIGGVIALIVLIVAIVLIIRHRRDKAWAEEYSVPFSGLNDDEELPKLLRDDDNNLDKDSINGFDENEEELTKEQAREKFLNNYNKDNNYNNYNEYEELEETPKRKKNKGKRFK